MKDSSGKVYAESSIPATRLDLDRWMKTSPRPRSAAMNPALSDFTSLHHLQVDEVQKPSCSSGRASNVIAYVPSLDNRPYRIGALTDHSWPGI